MSAPRLALRFASLVQVGLRPSPAVDMEGRLEAMLRVLDALRAPNVDTQVKFLRRWENA